MIGDTSPTADIVAAGDNLYRLQTDGEIRRYDGHRWDVLWCDKQQKTLSITACGYQLYRRQEGKVWRYAGTPISGWEVVDESEATVDIIAGDWALYKRHNDGSIWQMTLI
ncbi:hypothetical protein VTN00DRAFT_3949 [Thermoascus crustaceus]|uniref:uncharacterized protein n=1 Tax=Thermoascus crustaceus TaxID=5088 RepID=UPI00374412F2